MPFRLSLGSLTSSGGCRCELVTHGLGIAWGHSRCGHGGYGVLGGNSTCTTEWHGWNHECGVRGGVDGAGVASVLSAILSGDVVWPWGKVLACNYGVVPGLIKTHPHMVARTKGRLGLGPSVIIVLLPLLAEAKVILSSVDYLRGQQDRCTG